MTEEERKTLQELLASRMNVRILRADPATYDKEKRSVKVVATTETPTPVIDWDRLELVDEILLMSGFSLPTGRSQVPLLDTHSRFSVDDILGSAREFQPEGEKLLGNVYFASSAKSIDAETKVRDGHLTDLSVGYRVDESFYVPEGQKQIINGKTYDGPIKVSTKWTLKELSLVPIGADVFSTVKAIRSLPEFEEFVKRSTNQPPAAPSKPDTAGDQSITAANQRSTTMTDEEKQAAAKLEAETRAANLAEIRKAELQRIGDIEKWGKRFVGRGIEDLDKLITSARDNGQSLAEFKGIIADKLSEKGEPFTDPKLGLSDKEVKRYSLSRLIHAAASGDWKEAGQEREASQAIAKENSFDMGLISRRYAGNPTAVFVPHEIMHRSINWTPELGRLALMNDLLNKRDLTAGTSTAASQLVGTNLLASQFIEYPMNQLVMQTLGARVISGLVGNVDIPKKTGRSTFYMVETEGNAPTESQLAVNKVSLSPHIGGTFTDYTLKLLLQSTPGIDALVQADLLETCDLGVDNMCLNGSAATGEPRGLVNLSGIGTFDGTNLGFDGVTEALTDLMTANEFYGRLAWLSDPTTWGYCHSREKWIPSGQPLEQNMMMQGFPYLVSNQAAAGNLIFGNWSQAIIAFWSGYLLLVDPYTASSAGTTRVRVLVAFDFGGRRSTAWTIATSCT